MIFSKTIKQILCKKSGYTLNQPADAERLAIDIETSTGNHVGVNTLKRLLGFISDERNPRKSTLNIIAQYIGFDSWDMLAALDDKSDSSFKTGKDHLTATDIPNGQDIEIRYFPNRRIVITHLNDYSFVVKSSENSKLEAGDKLHLSHIVTGYPLFVAKVIRNGENLGQFSAGKKQGIRFKLIKK